MLGRTTPVVFFKARRLTWRPRELRSPIDCPVGGLGRQTRTRHYRLSIRRSHFPHQIVKVESAVWRTARGRANHVSGRGSAVLEVGDPAMVDDGTVVNSSYLYLATLPATPLAE